MKVEKRRNEEGSWGLVLGGAGLASAEQPRPLQLEIWDPAGAAVNAHSAGYTDWTEEQGAWVGAGRVVIAGGVAFEFRDRWEQAGDTLRLARTVTVRGSGPGGFLSAATLRLAASQSWPRTNWFVPGMIYGGFAHLSDASIGGRAHYKPGDFTVRIREDRLPAPLALAHFADGSSLAVLNPAPRGDTIAADALDTKVVPLVDERLQFGAIGGEERGDSLSVGYWFPGSEGEVTYVGNTYPDGQVHKWRRRFHPIQDGLTQRYEVWFRLGDKAPFTEAYPRAWRWAWQALRPAVTPNDIAAARRAIVDVVAGNVMELDGRTGLPFHLRAIPKPLPPPSADAASGSPAEADFRVFDEPPPARQRMILGFCGKNLEAAQFLLRESEMDAGPRGQRLRRLGEAIIATFLRLKVAPPEGEGFAVQSDERLCYIGHPEVYLRSFGDDMKSLMRAYLRERQHGREHPGWLAWCRAFVDWLLPQQNADGGFPRSWHPQTGAVVCASPQGSYMVVPLLTLMTEATGDRRYLEAAVRVGDYCWTHGQAEGRFVGGTIDNPDVLDKEAGTLSLEAYLHLHAATGGAQWLERAVAAAAYAETWIYLWNVPMPPDDDEGRRGWKRGVSTVGQQLIATGHSLSDGYMAFDTDDYAKVAALTGDAHYREVARILLHNTKNMLSLPAHPYDLKGTGWQQEHWSLSPPRGHGLHRGWLPWVACSQLKGIFGLMDMDAKVYADLARG